MNIKELVRNIINRTGFDVVRLQNSPQKTLLGLAGMKIGTVIDVGANEGQFARMISKFFPQATIYSFEPLPGPFLILSEWAKKQNGRVHCFQLALGEEECEMEMHMHEQHTPSSSLLESTQANHHLYPQTRVEYLIRVRVTTLDNVLSENITTMPQSILLKLDVQGFEDRVLRGGEKVLSHCRAVVLEACIESLYEGQAEFVDLALMLRNFGFHYAGNLNQSFGKDGHVIFFDALFLK